MDLVRLLMVIVSSTAFFLLTGCSDNLSQNSNSQTNSGSPLVVNSDSMSVYSDHPSDSLVSHNNITSATKYSAKIVPDTNQSIGDRVLDDSFILGITEPNDHGTRSLFCSLPRNFQRGRYLKTSKYGPIGQAQEKLGLAVDGIMGRQTTAAINEYKRKKGFETNSCLDVQTWKSMFPDRPVPSHLDRAISLTFYMEGTDYDKIERNYGTADKSGMTWGPLGMTLASGEIQTILKNIMSKHSQLSNDLNNSDMALLSKLSNANMSTGSNMNFNSIKALVNKLARLDYVRKEYDLEAYRSVNGRFKYYENYLQEMAKNNVVTELDWAMFWDVATQTGYAQKKSNALRSTVAVNVNTPNLDERRRRMGDVIANMVSSRWKQDRTLRNSAFYGENSFVGKAYGFDERPIFDSAPTQTSAIVDETPEEGSPNMEEVAF